jgi:NADPH:quinone reductase-like Zn-dependent oxidoreductase
MKAVVLVKNASAHDSFEIREVEKPKAEAGQALIKSEAFGLNFADIMARQGNYQDWLRCSW